MADTKYFDFPLQDCHSVDLFERIRIILGLDLQSYNVL